MNVAHDHKTCLAGHPLGRPGNADAESSPSLDWQGLRSRLVAAQEVRSALSPEDRPLPFHKRGSFDGTTASLLTTYEGLQTGVNPTASTNRKPREVTMTPVADPSSTGGRG